MAHEDRAKRERKKVNGLNFAVQQANFNNCTFFAFIVTIQKRNLLYFYSNLYFSYEFTICNVSSNEAPW